MYKPQNGLLNIQVQLLVVQKDKLQRLCEKTMVNVEQLFVRQRARSRRKANGVKVRAFVASVQNDPDDWYQETWDGDIWDEAREGGKFYPYQERPIVHRRKVERFLPPVREQMFDDQGQPLRDDSGHTIYHNVPQPEPDPDISKTLEDYSAEELIHLNNKFRQKPDEQLDLWMSRLLEEGAWQTEVYHADGDRFSGLSRDPRVNSEYRLLSSGLEEQAASIGDMYGHAVAVRYPSLTYWPPLDREWHTIMFCGWDGADGGGNLISLGGSQIPRLPNSVIAEIVSPND